MPEISIVDTKNIIRAIKLKYKVDLGSFQLNTLRYKLDRILSDQHLQYPDILITRLIEDSEFYSELIDNIYSSDIELFRDPEFWSEFSGILSEQIIINTEQVNFLLPVCSNGFELYSLMIFLEEKAFFDKSHITVLYNSSTADKIHSSNTGFKISHLGLENFSKLFPDTEMEKYFFNKGNQYFFRKEKMSLIKKSKHEILTGKIKNKYQIIFFRDRLINFEASTQEQIIKKLSASLVKNGVLILGYRENPGKFIRNSGIFETIDETNRIFRKIV